MSIKITLEELLASRNVWKRLGEATLPVKTSYWVGKRLKAVESELRDYDRHHNELVKQYGAPVEGQPGRLQVKPECMEEFIKLVTELQEIAVELPFEPFSISDLENAKLSVRDTVLLDKFLVE